MGHTASSVERCALAALRSASKRSPTFPIYSTCSGKPCPTHGEASDGLHPPSSSAAGARSLPASRICCARTARPGATRIHDGYARVLVSYEPSRKSIGYLDHLISDVSCSPLITQLRRDFSIGIIAINESLWLLPRYSPLDLRVSPRRPDPLEHTEAARYHRSVDRAIRALQAPLVRIKDILTLTNSEVSGLLLSNAKPTISGTRAATSRLLGVRSSPTCSLSGNR